MLLAHFFIPYHDQFDNVLDSITPMVFVMIDVL